MAHELVRLALTRLDAVQAEVPLGTRVLTEVAHEARGTDAVAVVLPARRLILALALVLAILPVLAILTGHRAVGARPAGWTIAFARHVRALAAVLAIALERTVCAVEAVPTRVLTRRPGVAWGALQAATHMVTLLRDILLHLAFVVAVLAVEALLAGFIALLAGPPGRAVALATRLIARRIVLAITLLLAFRAVESGGTLRLA